MGNSIKSTDNVTIKLGILAALVLAVQHLMGRITDDEKFTDEKDDEIAALHRTLAQEDTDLAGFRAQVAELQTVAGQPMPDDIQANIEAILAADLTISQPDTPPPSAPPAPTSSDADVMGNRVAANPYETLTPGTQVPASVNVPAATGAQLPPSGAVTGDLPGNVAPVTGSGTGVGTAPPVQQGTENVEGSKLTPGEPSQDGQKNPDAAKVD